MPDAATPVQELELVLPSEIQGREAQPLGPAAAPRLFLRDEPSSRRFWEFFTANIPNDQRP